MNQEKKMNKGLVISVGAGYPQTSFIQSLKEQGFSVAAFGKGRNDPNAVQSCDYFNQIDTSDYEAAIAWINTLPSPIIGSGSYAGGVAINTLQEIDRHFNLPTRIPARLSVGMDKYDQQKLYADLDLSSIPTFRIQEIKNNRQLINLDTDYILKPTVGRGSAGVFRLNGQEILNWIDADKTGDADLIQAFISGKEYRLMAIIQEGQLKFLAQINRDSLEGTFLLGRLSIVTTDEDRLKDFMRKLIKNGGIANAIIKLDVLVSTEALNMIEMDIGVGGGIYFKDFIEWAYNYDVTQNYIRLITNGIVEANHNLPKKDVKMDYIFNKKGVEINYDLKAISSWLSEHIGNHKIVENLLNLGKSGKFSSNAHFIFTIIHQNSHYTTAQLNQEINEHFFKEV